MTDRPANAIISLLRIESRGKILRGLKIKRLMGFGVDISKLDGARGGSTIQTVSREIVEEKVALHLPKN